MNSGTNAGKGSGTGTDTCFSGVGRLKTDLVVPSQHGPSLELGLKLAAVFGVPVEAVFALTPFPTLASQLAIIAKEREKQGDD